MKKGKINTQQGRQDEINDYLLHYESFAHAKTKARMHLKQQ